MRYLIGLTGGIATGKSTVSNYLMAQGYRVIDADKIARLVVEPGSQGLEQLVALCGDTILLENGQLNRSLFGQRLFQDDALRAQVNRLLHPLIFAEIAHQVAQSSERVLFIDMPLLYEVGYQTQVDEVWVVYVPQPVQLQRLMARNNWHEERAQQAIASQWSIEQKRELADYVIDNQQDPTHTFEQVKAQLERLSQA